MQLSISKTDLLKYITKQLNNIFPDLYEIRTNDFGKILDLALDRLEFCYQHVKHPRYNVDGNVILNHLYSDHYVMLIWYISNCVYVNIENANLASKLYYLNKTLHGFDCMYDTKLPNIFLLFHCVGTMLGKADYGEYFVALQGVTVGSHKGKYPVIGSGVSLTAHSSIIGNCNIGNRVSISAYTNLFQINVENDVVVYKNEVNCLSFKQSNNCYAQQFFINTI
jgi:serine O-acetyltransferase